MEGTADQRSGTSSSTESGGRAIDSPRFPTIIAMSRLSAEFAAKFSGLELYRLVASIVRLICGRSLRLSAGDSML
jgi:hypothetical protein